MFRLIFEVVVPAELVIELGGGDQLGEFGIEADLGARVSHSHPDSSRPFWGQTYLVSSDGIHKGGDGSEECVDPPTGASSAKLLWLRTEDNSRHVDDQTSSET